MLLIGERKKLWVSSSRTLQISLLLAPAATAPPTSSGKSAPFFPLFSNFSTSEAPHFCSSSFLILFAKNPPFPNVFPKIQTFFHFRAPGAHRSFAIPLPLFRFFCLCLPYFVYLLLIYCLCIVYLRLIWRLFWVYFALGAACSGCCYLRCSQTSRRNCLRTKRIRHRRTSRASTCRRSQRGQFCFLLF